MVGSMEALVAPRPCSMTTTGASDGPASRYGVRMPPTAAVAGCGKRAGRSPVDSAPSSSSDSARLPRTVSLPFMKAPTPLSRPDSIPIRVSASAWMVARTRFPTPSVRSTRPSRSMCTVQHPAGPASIAAATGAWSVIGPDTRPGAAARSVSSSTRPGTSGRWPGAASRPLGTGSDVTASPPGGRDDLCYQRVTAASTVVALAPPGQLSGPVVSPDLVEVRDVRPVGLVGAGRAGQPRVQDLGELRRRGQPQAEREHVGVVPPAGALGRGGVHAQSGAHAGDLVRRDRGAGPGPAAHHRLVGAAGGDVPRGRLAGPRPVVPLAGRQHPVGHHLVTTAAQLLDHLGGDAGVLV